MMANPESAPKIDWDNYKSRVPVQGMVDDFRKKYESLSIPYPSDNVTPQIDQQEKETVSSCCSFKSVIEMYEHHCYWSEWCFQLKEIQGFVKQSSARIVGYEAEVARLKSLLPYEQMTMEDFKDAYPDQVS